VACELVQTQEQGILAETLRQREHSSEQKRQLHYLTEKLGASLPAQVVAGYSLALGSKQLEEHLGL